MDRVLERFLAIEKLPIVQAAKLQADTERRERRRELLRQIEGSKQRLKRIDTELVAKAAPIERKLAALRAEIAGLEAGLEPLARSRITAMSSCEHEVATLREELRTDAAGECENFKRIIEITRLEVSNNCGGRRHFILDTMAAPNSRIASALANLLHAYREVGRIAVEEADVATALDPIRKLLAAADIKLLE